MFLGSAAIALGSISFGSTATSVAESSSESTFDTISWEQYQFDAANTGHATTRGPKERLTPEWHFDDGGNVGVQSAPAVADGTAYFTSVVDDGSGFIHAVDIDTGTEQWRVETPHGDYGSPALADGMVIAAPVDHGPLGPLRALEADTGEQRWEASGRSPTVAAGTVYYFYDDEVKARSIDDGTEQWSYSPARTGYMSVASPAVADGTVIFSLQHGSGEERILAMDADTGEKQWHVLFGSSTNYVPTIADGTVYFVTERNLFAYDVADGTERWRVPLSQIGTRGNGGSVAVENGVVYAPDEEDVVAIDTESREVLWRFGGSSISVSSAPVVADGTVYVGTDGGGIYTLEAGTGEVLGQFVPDTDLSMYEPPAVVDGTVYAGLINWLSTEDRGQGMYALETGDQSAASAEPTVDFDWSPETIRRETPTTFEERADEFGDLEDVDGTVEYHWDFDDGTETRTQDDSVEHRFAESGTYAVTLTVENSFGWTAGTTQSVEVIDETYEPPEPIITTDPPDADEGKYDGDSLVLDGTESNAGTRPIERYAWDVSTDTGGDDEVDYTGETVELDTADWSGIRYFTLEVTDSVGGTARTEISVLFTSDAEEEECPETE